MPKASDWAAGLSRAQTATEQSRAAHLWTTPLTVRPFTAQTAAAHAPTPHAPVTKAPAATAAAAQAAAKARARTAPAVAAKGAAKGQAAPARAAGPHANPAHAAALRPPQARRVAPAGGQMRPFLIYDSVTPSSIPGGQQVATYANGSYAASGGSVAGRGHVLWIDTNGSDTRADVLDVEPGDATPSGAAQWVKAKLSAQPNSVAIVYTMLSDWQAVKGYVGALPSWMQGKVHYWIADPTGVNHVVPGSNATQWYWGQKYDITTAVPGFES